MSQPQRITFVLDDLFTPETREMSDAVLGYLLTALTAIDLLYLEQNPKTPLLYDAGITYQEEPPGCEDWANIPMIRKLGWGDCLPLDTPVLRENGEWAPIGLIKIGDKLVGDGQTTIVLEACVTKAKPILRLDLDNGRVLRCSSDHKSFLIDETLLRASEMRVGMRLKTPPSTLPDRENGAGIVAITEEPAEVVGDLRTDTGRFYLPASDVITSNCEELAAWRAAELQLRGIPARAGFEKQTQADGTMLYHITVILPDGTIEDPSRQLGMR